MAKKAPRSKRVTGPDGGTVVLRKNANGDGSVYWDASGERRRSVACECGRSPSSGCAA